MKKSVALPHQLSWSHILSILPIDDINEINYYIDVSIKQSLSYRTFRNKRKNNEYHRYETISEKTLQKLILEDIEYNCYVVVELKIIELKKEHIQVYINYIDENFKKINQDKTVGIIICKQDNKYVIKYCSDNRILAREYELVI